MCAGPQACAAAARAAADYFRGEPQYLFFCEAFGGSDPSMSLPGLLTSRIKMQPHPLAPLICTLRKSQDFDGPLKKPFDATDYRCITLLHELHHAAASSWLNRTPPAQQVVLACLLVLVLDWGLSQVYVHAGAQPSLALLKAIKNSYLWAG